jgi:hypothetical protein
MALLFAASQFALEDYQGSNVSWSDLAGWYNGLTIGRYVLPPEARQQVSRLITGLGSDKQKTQALYAFLQSYTRYVAIALGVGGWQPHSAQYVFENRYGDCKDLSTFLIALLAEAGIKGYPALTLTRNKGIVFKDFPSNQFNHCLIFVPLRNDTLWFDGTAKFIAAGDLPAGVEGCDALVVKECGGEIVRTPQSRSSENLWMSTIEGKLSVTGALRFCGKLSATGNVAHAIRVELNSLRSDERKQWLGRMIGKHVPKLDSLTYEIGHLSESFDRPLTIRFTGVSPKFGGCNPERIFINPNMVNRETAAELPRAEKRQFPIHYDYAYTKIDSIMIDIPAGFDLEAAPQPLEAGFSFGHFMTSLAMAGGKVIYSRIYRLDQTQIPPEHYTDYAAYLKTVAKNDAMKLVLKKKAFALKD